VHVRDLFDVTREYQNPPRYLNFYTWKDAGGQWRRTRAVSLSVLMKPASRSRTLTCRPTPPWSAPARNSRMISSSHRTSISPCRSASHVSLFMKSLWEAVLLIIAVAFVGFWEWRSPRCWRSPSRWTLAMTFGMMRALGIDLQQVSIASLIIALGLLVDDPVVAGDAIKRQIEAGHKRLTAAWLGPTRLANAIVFATATNIAAYLPLLLMEEDTGRFIYSLPVVMTCALVASRLVSMTFVPLLAFHLLRRKKTERDPARRKRGEGLLPGSGLGH